MTHLRKIMLEELQRRNCAATTITYYLKAVEAFAQHFGKPPDRLNREHLRECQAYLLRERKLEPRTVKLHTSALRFFFVKTLKRRYLLDDIPFPKVPRQLPVILTVEEVGRLINAARNLLDRTLLMVLYSTGMRNFELRQLQVKDIDSQSMLIHIQRGKGGRGHLHAVEIKRSVSDPRPSKGFHLACGDLQVGGRWVIYPGRERYRLDARTEAIPFAELARPEFRWLADSR